MNADRSQLIQKLMQPQASVSYGRQYIDQDDIAEVEKVLRSPFLTMGGVATAFEAALCNLTGAKHAIVCTNGTSALHLACLGLRVSEYDLGLTAPITFLSSANCIEFCQGRADFIDIDAATLCLSPRKLEEYCHHVTIPKVVIPVDFAGVPANLPEIFTLAQKYGFSVIEDAAHAIGSSYQDAGHEYQCGSCAHTDVAIFSFHPVKTITTGEGGAVLTNDDNLAARIRKMRNHGVSRRPDLMRKNDGPWYYEMDELSYNFRLTDFQCALGLSQLKKLPFFRSRRQEIFLRYSNAFSRYAQLLLPPAPPNASVCPHLYVLQFMEGSYRRNLIYDVLKSYQIFCQIHYIPVYLQPYYQDKYHYPPQKCPESEMYYSRCLSLPLYPSLENDVVDFVIDIVIDCLQR